MDLIHYAPFNDLERIDESARMIGGLGGAELAVVLGTGFLPADDVPWQEMARIDCADVPHFPSRQDTYHRQQLILVRWNGVSVLLMTGRYHLYEGFALQEVAYPVRVLARLGLEALVLTSACGGLRPDLSVGDYVLVEDHINLSGLNPLIGRNLDDLGPRFPSLVDGYDRTLVDRFRISARNQGLNIQSGVLGFLPGPCLESLSELRILREMKVDLIGWSLVPEAVTAIHAGLPVMGISVVSDISNPERAVKVDEGAILRGAQTNVGVFLRVFGAFLAGWRVGRVDA